MNPYLIDNRLNDLIGLLQFCGNYRKYKLTPDVWMEKMDFSPSSSDCWEKVFKDHPEFFRINKQGQVSLIWRKTLPHKKDNSSREELPKEYITALIDVALDLHSKAKEEKRDNRYWIPIAAATLGFLGAVFGAWIKNT